MTRRALIFLLLPLVTIAALYLSYSLLRGPKSYRISSGEKDGAYFAFATGLQHALGQEERAPSISIKETSGSLENLQHLENGNADFALIQNGIRKKSPARVVAKLYQEVVHILIAKDSPISGLSDLRGKRLSLGLPQSGSRSVSLQLLSHYGITDSDFTDLSLDPDQSAEALLSGDADAVIIVSGLRSLMVEDLLATQKVRFLSLGSATEPGNLAHGIHEHYPHLQPFTIPRHAYATRSEQSPPLPNTPISALSVSSLLVCHPDIPDRTVRRVTRAIFSNRDLLLQHSPNSRHIRELSDSDIFPYPLHPGAEAYYRRKDPSFLILYADVIALFFTIAVTAAGMASGLRKWAETRRKNRIDAYYDRVNQVIETLHSPLAVNLDSEEEKLMTLNREAFRDLVNEKLKADESFRIFQTLFEHGLTEIQWRRQKTITAPASNDPGS